jgi:hypothetical protein
MGKRAIKLWMHCCNLCRIEPGHEDIKDAESLSIKIASLETYLKEAFVSENEILSSRIEKFQKDIEENKTALNEFMRNKRKQHAFPNSVDFNFEYYSIKLKQGPNCNSSI